MRKVKIVSRYTILIEIVFDLSSDLAFDHDFL